MKGSDAMNFLFVLWCWITAFGLLGCGITAFLEWRQRRSNGFRIARKNRRITLTISNANGPDMTGHRVMTSWGQEYKIIQHRGAVVTVRLLYWHERLLDKVAADMARLRDAL